MSENKLFENCKEEILTNILYITKNSSCTDVNESTSVNNLASAYLKLVQAEHKLKEMESGNNGTME